METKGLIRKFRLYRITDGTVEHNFSDSDIRVLTLLFDMFENLTTSDNKYYLNSEEQIVFKTVDLKPFLRGRISGLQQFVEGSIETTINLSLFDLTFPNVASYGNFIQDLIEEMYDIKTDTLKFTCNAF